MSIIKTENLLVALDLCKKTNTHYIMTNAHAEITTKDLSGSDTSCWGLRVSVRLFLINQRLSLGYGGCSLSLIMVLGLGLERLE